MAERSPTQSSGDLVWQIPGCWAGDNQRLTGLAGSDIKPSSYIKKSISCFTYSIVFHNMLSGSISKLIDGLAITRYQKIIHQAFSDIC